MSKHTPGPWVYTPNILDTIDVVITEDNKPRKKCISVLSSWMLAEEKDANARLIAAAPDMHKDLTRCLDTLCLLMEYELDGTLMRFLSDLIDEVSATVDKAEGKE